MCHGQGCRVFLGMGDLQPLIGNPYNGYINPYYWVDDQEVSLPNIFSLGVTWHNHISKQPKHCLDIGVAQVNKIKHDFFVVSWAR